LIFQGGEVLALTTLKLVISAYRITFKGAGVEELKFS